MSPLPKPLGLLPPLVGLCPDPSHTEDFYVPHDGPCPMGDCGRQLAVYVPAGAAVAAIALAIRNGQADDGSEADEAVYDDAIAYLKQVISVIGDEPALSPGHREEADRG